MYRGKDKGLKIMSKADRIRRAHAEEIARLQQKKKKTQTPGWVYGLIAGVIGAVATAVIVILALQVSGVTLRNTVSVVGTGDDDRMEIDNAVMCYYYMTNYSQYVNSYGSYLSYLGLDTSDSLKTQEYYGGDGKTWFEYFADQTKTQVKELVITAMAAEKAGFSAEDKVNAYIDSAIENIQGYAKKNGYSLKKYITLCYGTGVSESDLREALKLYYTAQAFYDHLNESYNYTDAEIDAYFAENAKDYQYFNLLSYTFKAEYESSATTKEKETALAEAKKTAEGLLACKTPEEYKAWVKKYLQDQDKSDSDIETALEDLVSEDLLYNENYGYSKWIYEDGRKLNDATLIVDEDGYTCTVYMVTKLPARYEYNTVNVHHILFSKDVYGSDDKAKAKAEEVLAAFKTDATVANFEKLAKEFTEDTGSVLVGGAYENVTKDYMVDEFDAWIFAENRVAGDCEIVKTSYGYHIIYFDGVSDPAWKAAVISSMKSDDYSEAYEGFEKIFTVEFDDRKLSKLPF